MKPDYLSSMLAGIRRQPQETVTHVDGKEIEKRPKPPVTHATVMRTRFYCERCKSMEKVETFSEEFQSIRLRCGHNRMVSMKTVGA